MIELKMVGRMTKRAVALAPLLIAALFLFGGLDYALSGAIGLAMTLANLWLSGRIIGGVAETNPRLLLPAGMIAFAFGLGLLTAIAFALEALDIVTFEVTGFTLIGSHLLLVLWEAARAYPAKQMTSDRDPLKMRS